MKEKAQPQDRHKAQRQLTLKCLPNILAKGANWCHNIGVTD